jgi:hypothetical protein
MRSGIEILAKNLNFGLPNSKVIYKMARKNRMCPEKFEFGEY